MNPLKAVFGLINKIERKIFRATLKDNVNLRFLIAFAFDPNPLPNDFISNYLTFLLA